MDNNMAKQPLTDELSKVALSGEVLPGSRIADDMRLVLRRWRWTLVTITVLVIFAIPARADYESAVAAYEAGDYEEARREFERLARNGNARAQAYLGSIIEKGTSAADQIGRASSASPCGEAIPGESNGQWHDRLIAFFRPSI